MSRKPEPAVVTSTARNLQVTIYPEDDANITAIIARLRDLGHSRPKMADAVRYSLRECASRIGSD